MIYHKNENNFYDTYYRSELILSCVCDGHFLVIREVIDKDATLANDQQVFVAEFYEPKSQIKKPSFLYRIKSAWKMLTTGQYEADGINLVRSDAIAMKEYLEKCINDYTIQNNPTVECFEN